MAIETIKQTELPTVQSSPERVGCHQVDSAQVLLEEEPLISDYFLGDPDFVTNYPIDHRELNVLSTGIHGITGGVKRTTTAKENDSVAESYLAGVNVDSSAVDATEIADLKQPKLETLPENLERHYAPRASLTVQEREDLDQYHQDLRKKYPEEWENLIADPDIGNKVVPRTMFEAEAALALRDSGRVPENITRPRKGESGDFVVRGASGVVTTTYEHKAVVSDWPSWSPKHGSAHSYSYGYNSDPQRFIDKIDMVNKCGQVPILDTRYADEEAIADLKQRANTQLWGKNVIWYP